MIKYLKAATRFEDYPTSSLEMVICGRSNAGKSSFINALFNQKIAYVGKTPGKTRLINFFETDRGYTLADVPGYGYAKISKKELLRFGEMMEEYFKKRTCLKLVVLVIDIRRTPNDDDLAMLEVAKDRGLEILIIANKADKVNQSDRIKNTRRIAEGFALDIDDVIAFSSLKKKPLDKVSAAIMQKLGLQ